MDKVYCDTCGAECVPSGVTTGYGTDKDGKRHCFACCGELDKARMIETGRAVLYLTTPPRDPRPLTGTAYRNERVECYSGAKVSNWPGTLSFTCGMVRIGRHNFAGRRYDTDFCGPDGARWVATQYGDNTQIAHCRRVKH